MISTFTAFFDSNVFFGTRLRSLCMEQALTGLFRARWSKDVHREWIAAVLEKRPDITAADLEKTRRDMDESVLDCVVTGYEELIPVLALPDADDRHILAAAIVARASVIVTFNERDFPADQLKPHGIHAAHPDDFLLDLDSIDPVQFIEAVASDLRHYTRQPLSVDEYLDDLAKAGLPKTVDHLRARKVLLETEHGAS